MCSISDEFALDLSPATISLFLSPTLATFIMSEAPKRPRYEDPGDFIYDTYLKASKDEDEARPKNWEGSTTGILTFVRTI